MHGRWLLPSRRRIPSLKRFFAAAEQTFMTTGGYILVNRLEYEELRAEYNALALPEGWAVLPVEANSVVEAMNAGWEHVKDCDWVGGLCDDHVPVTPEWDTKLIEHVTGWNVVSSDDAWQAPKRIHGAIVWSGDLLRTLGGIYPSGFKHFFVDDVWETLGHDMNCWTVRMDVTVAHMHAQRTGKSDATTEHIGRFWDADEKRFREWKAKDRRVMCDAIMGLCEQRGIRIFRPNLSGMSIYIASPCHDEKYDRRYVKAFENTTNMIRQSGGMVDWGEAPGVAEPALARAKLAGAFLRSHHDKMLMIDSDMGWSPIDVIRLASLGLDFVAVAGPKKTGERQFAFRALDASSIDITQINGIDLMEVAGVGGAFCLISRACIERMVAAYPEQSFFSEIGQLEHALFDNLIVEQQRLSEDYSFCHRWRAIGGKVYIAPSMALSHSGAHTWRGAAAEIMRFAEAAE